MFTLAIPLLAFVVLLVTALVVSRRRLVHPAVVLSAEYVVIGAFSVVFGVMNEAENSFPKDAVWNSTLLALLIAASLAPSFLIKKPALDLSVIRKQVGRSTLGFAAIAGAVGFISLLPALISSFSFDAYSAKVLGASPIMFGGPITFVGSFFGAFSCVFGLLLFCDTKFELNWFVRLGLLLGFLTYGVLAECHKDRNAMVYYPMYMMFYFWLFRDKWQRKMKALCYTFFIFMLVFGSAMFTAKTVQRFAGPGAAISVEEGTVGYLGQQVANFIEVAENPHATENISKICFPVYFSLQNGEWVDVTELLIDRTEQTEYVFSTFVGTLFMALGRQWAIAALLVLAVIAGAFFSGPMKQAPVTYVLGIMLYYQILFQGAFYFMQIGRFGNGFIIGMICMTIATYRMPGKGATRIA